ncbi:MAG: hypothetical protein JST48_04160 [Bacteroidetes bacterium]|nr:hypothetical protein [Bacteroidota bacterium]
MNKNILGFTSTLVALSFGIGSLTRKLGQPTFLFLILAVLAAATWLVYFFMARTKSEDFIKNYMLTIVVKLILGGVFISVLIFLDKKGAEENAVLFMASYLIFTALEVGFLFKRFNRS